MATLPWNNLMPRTVMMDFGFPRGRRFPSFASAFQKQPRGRVGTQLAFEHFKVARRMGGTQNSLF